MSTNQTNAQDLLNAQLAKAVQDMANANKPLLTNRNKHGKPRYNLILNNDLTVYAKFVNTTLSMLGYQRLNPFNMGNVLDGVLMIEEDGRFAERIEYPFDYDSCVIEIYSELELSFFAQTNRTLIDAGLLIRNDSIDRDTDARYIFGKLAINPQDFSANEGVLL